MPWLIWGNSPRDKTTINQRIDDTLGSCSKESVEVGKLFIEYGYRPSISTLTSIAGKSPDVFRHPSESLEKAQRYITDIFSYTLKYAKLKD